MIWNCFKWDWMGFYWLANAAMKRALAWWWIECVRYGVYKLTNGQLKANIICCGHVYIIIQLRSLHWKEWKTPELLKWQRLHILLKYIVSNLVFVATTTSIALILIQIMPESKHIFLSKYIQHYISMVQCNVVYGIYINICLNSLFSIG